MGTRLGPDEHLRRLALDVEAYTALLRQVDRSLPVTGCAPWTVEDLTRHLGSMHRWALVAARDGRDDPPVQNGPADPAALTRWFCEGGRSLVAILASLAPQAPCWTFAEPSRTAFWRRRQMLETAVHRWDAETAAGLAAHLDPAVAADGLDEVVDVLFPRQVRLGRARTPAQPVRLEATDVAGTWVVGDGTPVGAVSGPAASLLLLLWGRMTLEDGGLVADGDRAAVRASLERALTP